MGHHSATLLPLSAVDLGITALSTVPGFLAFLAQWRDRKPKDNFYQDVDGKATPESNAAFSNKSQKLAILSLSITGLGLSIAISVLATLNHTAGEHLLEDWFSTGALALIFGQAILVAAQHDPVQCFQLGLWGALSSSLTAASLITQTVTAAEPLDRYDSPAFILRILNCATLIFLTITCLLIPRRPEVFRNDHKVDGKLTASALSRFTWTWVQPVIDEAAKKGDLDEKDVPGVDHITRCDWLSEAWASHNFNGTLLRSIIWAYKGIFAFQWTLTAFRCLLGLGPFWTLLQIITRLEKNDNDKAGRGDLWALMVYLALFKLAEQWLDNFVNWFSVSNISFPLRSQLSSLIFEKSLRRKNVKAADSTNEKGAAADVDAKKSNGKKPADGKAPADGKKSGDKKNKTEETDSSSVLKSKQAIVNLVGVDARRIAGFAAIQFIIPNSAGKLIVYSGFLVQLIGWVPFMIGMLAWALLMPINTWASKRYIRAEEDLMKVRDEKLAVVNEALVGMRQIKFSAMEAQWEKRILGWREKEIATIVRVFSNDIVIFACWILSPIVLASASLATYASVHGGLTPSIAFVSISIFKSLEVTLSALPELLTMMIDTYVSIKRVEAYLNGPEMKQIRSTGSDVSLENATVAWPVDDEVPDEDRFILNNVSLSFPRGELSVISGKTGTGKSLLLSAILGEVDLLDGEIFVPHTLAPLERNDAKAHPGNWILAGSIAYVSQTPWLESASLKDNILFGLPFLEDRYDNILEICALKKDMNTLTDGDKTLLGANGINLSGGQKWRVTLARAIYSRAEILIMDDIFSAVDAHVGRQIFEQCIAGDLCKNRTRILVTHHVALVQSKTKFLVELGEGSVMHAGLLSDLEGDGTLQKIKSHEQSQAEIEAEEGPLESTAVNSEEASVAEQSSSQTSNDLVKPAVQDSKDAKKFIQDEGREKGMVKRRVYAIYVKATGGLFFWSIVVMLFVTFEVSNVGRNWWLKIWTGSDDGVAEKINVHDEHGYAYGFSLQQTAHAAHGPMVSTTSHHPVSYYLRIYIAIALGGGIFGVLRILWILVMSVKASKALFRKILYTVLRTPLRWLDTVPVGRILNRLTSDFDIIDNRLTMDLAFVFWQMMNIAGICVAATLVSPYALILGFSLLAAAMLIARKYIGAARPVKRMESNSKSPVFEIFNAALAGVTTLRAFRKTGVYINRMNDSLDPWASISVHIWLLNHWLGLRLALIGTVFTTLVGIFIITSPWVDASIAGFAMSFALDFSQNIIFAVRFYANLEMDMNAAERIIEYSELKIEPQEGETPPAAWPTKGTMEIENLEVAYAEDLDPVLKGISFSVKNNERIGVVGRTGAGKSSLTLALFRFLEPRGGKVMVDGLDISKIDLHSLRSRLAIIPQDPVLFSGTIRSNLDPFDNYTDAELRECLGRAHLTESLPATPANEPSSAAGSTIAPKNANIFKDLSSNISESGGNLSQGQRQLLCLARAIVSRPKIMVLDEATSAVDMTTDTLIQRSIRDEFTDSTLIVIAHRLSTIADFDRILVLSDGKVAEFGTPRELWEKDNGMFRDMCEHSGERDKLSSTIMGN